VLNVATDREEFLSTLFGRKAPSISDSIFKLVQAVMGITLETLGLIGLIDCCAGSGDPCTQRLLAFLIRGKQLSAAGQPAVNQGQSQRGEQPSKAKEFLQSVTFCTV
jgi:hypothetical protein